MASDHEIDSKSAPPAKNTEHPELNGTATHPLQAASQDANLHPNQAHNAVKNAEKELEADAKAIREATGKNHWYSRADRETINKILEGKTEAERQTIEKYYKQNNNGQTLETDVRSIESGSNLDTFVNILNRKDNDAADTSARRLHEDLLENKNLFEGRNSSIIEKDIRDIFSNHNAAQTARMENIFAHLYQNQPDRKNGLGENLKEAILQNKSLSQATRDMAKIYLKGNDKRSDQDTAALIKIALEQKNLQYFTEVMKDASPAARKVFLEQNGEQQISNSFGHWYSNKSAQEALDYARFGKLSATTQVEINTHLISNVFTNFFSNKDGIELSITQMSDSERNLFRIGKSLCAGNTVKNLSPEQIKTAKESYEQLHKAFTKAGNDSQVVAWESQITSGDNNSLVSNLLQAKGHLWNSSDKEIKDIVQNMNETQWQASRSDPQQREALKSMLVSLNKPQSSVDNILKLYDRMITASDFKQAKDEGYDATKETVLAKLDDAQHFYGTNDAQMLKAISTMSLTEQKLYRTNYNIRFEVDDALRTLKSESNKEAASRILKDIQQGKDPSSDVIAKLEVQSKANSPNSADVLRSLDNQLRNDSVLKARITNPQNDTDKEFSEQFKKAVQGAFGKDYDTLGKPFVEKGHASLESKLNLDQHLFKNNYDQAFTDIKDASPEERQRLKIDPVYQKSLIGFMSAEHIKIAMAIADKGAILPEDRIRISLIDKDSADDLLANLKDIPATDFARAKSEYSNKYGTSLDADMFNKLSGQNKLDAEQLFAQNLSQENRFTIARDRIENTQTGVGASISRNIFNSGTGTQAEDSVERANLALSEKNKLDAALADSSSVISKMTPEAMQSLQSEINSRLNSTLEVENKAQKNLAESKSAPSEYIADAGVVAASVVALGSVIATGGLDAPLVASLAAAGASIRIGSKALMQGNDYDSSIAGISKDATVGAVTGAASVFGPSEVALILGVGKGAAVQSIDLLLSQVGASAFKEGSREAMQKGTEQIIRRSLATGAKEFDKEAINKLVAANLQSDLEGGERAKLIESVSTGLQKNVGQFMVAGVARTLTEQGLNAAGGAAGGGVGGATQGTTEWSASKGIGGNLAQIGEASFAGALSGGIGGGVMSAGMLGLKGLNAEFKAVSSEATSHQNLTAVKGPDGSHVHFDSSGRIARTVDVNNNINTFGYSEDGSLENVMLSDGTHYRKVDHSKNQWVLQTKDSAMPVRDAPQLNLDGTLRVSTTDKTLDAIYKPSGEIEYRDSVNNKLRKTANSDGTIKNPTPQRDEFHESVSERFSKLTEPTRLQDALVRTQADLGMTRAIDVDGKETSVLSSLQNDHTLSDRAKANIVRNLAEVREHYASYRQNDRMHPDCEINWIHTQGELGRVLQSARANKLTSDETENALLASMYSDSVKFAYPAPENAQPNFFTHHLDGALAAHESLSKQGFAPERIDSIVQSIHEHQLSPPEFMGSLYQIRIKDALTSLISAKELPRQKIDELETTFKSMIVERSDGRKAIRGIADVASAAKVQGENGHWEVAFSDKEKEVLKLAGIDKWSVPVEPYLNSGFDQLPLPKQEALISQYRSSRALIDGDSIDNYATAGGASKIVAIQGPGTLFKNATVWESVNSIDNSFKDAYPLLTDEGKKIANATVVARNKLFAESETGIRAKMDSFVASNVPEGMIGHVPYYDVPLKYPEPLSEAERAIFQHLDIQTLTLGQAHHFLYKGLNEQQIADLHFAEKIRSQMVSLLRSAARTDGSLPGRFEQSSITEPLSAPKLQPVPAEMPKATGGLQKEGDWSLTPTTNGTLVRAADGSSVLTDTVNGISRRFDAEGRLLDMSAGNNSRSFRYDEHGIINRIKNSDGSYDYVQDGQWKNESVRGGRKQVVPYEKGAYPVVDGDGTVRFAHGDHTVVDSIDGYKTTIYANGFTKNLSAPYLTEKANLATLVNTALEGNFVTRFNKLQDLFEARATESNMSENEKALLYQQLNRLLQPGKATAISQLNRQLLAEQIMEHSAHPELIAQGNNKTCTAATLEVRNYVRNPDKNAKIVADIALTGKVTTSDGTILDMSSLQAGLKADSEARTNLGRQKRYTSLHTRNDNERDWASQIVETALINARWQPSSVKILNGRQLDSFDLAFNHDGAFLGQVAKPHRLEMAYDSSGEPIGRNFRERDGAFDSRGKAVPTNELIFNKDGSFKGIAKESAITRVYDGSGKSPQSIYPGMRGFDANGKEIFKATHPGEVYYDKIRSHDSSRQERLIYRDGNRLVQLKDNEGHLITSPHLFASNLEGMNKMLTGLDDKNYILTDNNINSAGDLVTHMTRLQKEQNLPAVLGVYTARRPFSDVMGLNYFWGGGGHHVVNAHSFDAETNRILISNQWGVNHNYMENGVPLNKLFKATQAPPFHDYFHDHSRLPYAIGAGTVGIGATVYGLNKLSDSDYQDNLRREKEERRYLESLTRDDDD